VTPKKPAGDVKGPLYEELLRSYFLKAGYFVVRGVPFVYRQFDVTDIDLWLYNRVASVSREISIVDIKNKKTPQAIERIFWAKGLQEALGTTRAIVATTENRVEVKEFGKQMDVLVLDGRFLQRLKASSPTVDLRITDEEFRDLLFDSKLGKVGGDWAPRMRAAKAALANGLSFDSCNYWLDEARYFAEQVITRPQRRAVCLRCCYVVASFAAIAVDFILRELSFLEEPERETILRDGFIYGSRGRAGTKNVIDTAVGLVTQFTDRGASIATELRTGVERQISALPANILSQFFSRVEVGRSLFEVAKELEALGMARTPVGHGRASTGARSLIGCLLDFWGIDRRALNLDSDTPVQAELPALGVSDSDRKEA
jgi:hypothetical protein